MTPAIQAGALPISIQVEETPPFLKLPTEIILTIFDGVHLSTARRLQLTCWQFNVLIQDDSLWKTLFKRDFPTCLRPPLPSFRESYAHRHRFHTNFTHGFYTTRVLQGYRDFFNTFIVADGKAITGSNHIEIFDLVNGDARALQRGVGPIMALAVIGDRLFSGSLDSTINVYHLKASSIEKILTGHRMGVTCLGVYGEKLISGSIDDTVRIWDVATGESQCLEGHTNGVASLVVGPEGKLYTGSHDETIRVWDLKTREVLFILKGHKQGIMSLALNGENLISGCCGKEIKIWDLEKRSCLQTLTDTRDVLRLASIEGKFVSNSGRLWDSKQGKWLYTLNLTSAVFDLVMQGDKLFMGAGLRIWIFDFHAKDSEIFREIANLYRHPDSDVDAEVRFQRMPKEARKKIEEKLPPKPALNTTIIWQLTAPSQKAKAIEAYLEEVEQ